MLCRDSSAAENSSHVRQAVVLLLCDRSFVLLQAILSLSRSKGPLVANSDSNRICVRNYSLSNNACVVKIAIEWNSSA